MARKKDDGVLKNGRTERCSTGIKGCIPEDRDAANINKKAHITVYEERIYISKTSISLHI